MALADLMWLHRELAEEVRVHNLGVIVRRRLGESWDAPQNRYRNAVTEVLALEALKAAA